MRTCALFVACAGGLALALPARADILHFTVSLDGLQETPPVPTTGTGSAVATLDTATNFFSLSGSFSNLIGTTNNAHVHGPAPVGVPAGVMFGIAFDFGVSSGNFSFNGVISGTHATDITAGLSYVNIHSTFRPGGEIRGQVLLVPEPSILAALAVTGLGFARRRRR